jgi:L-aspartate oxidase
VQVLVEEGPARVRELQTAGAEFDLDPKGELLLGREARIPPTASCTHTVTRRVRRSRARSSHVCGRASGITVLERTRVSTSIVQRGACVGVRASVAGKAVGDHR